MLYTLSCSPYSCDLHILLRTVQTGDDMLLLADGVIAGLMRSPALRMLMNSPLIVFALENDVAARGLFHHFAQSISIIGYTDFVKLTEKQLQQMAW